MFPKAIFVYFRAVFQAFFWGANSEYSNDVIVFPVLGPRFIKVFSGFVLLIFRFLFLGSAWPPKNPQLSFPYR